MFKRLAFTFSLTLALLSSVAHAVSDGTDGPKVINIGVADAGVGGRPATGGSPISSAHARGVLEEAFKEDGIQVKWVFFPTAGPGVNEALSNNLLDFAFQGDLPNLVGKAAGLPTKLILAEYRKGNLYVVAREGSGIESLKDLRGKKVALFKGTCLQLSTNRILQSAGLTENDVRFYNMDFASTTAALASGDIDAAFTGATGAFPLRDRGIAKVIYDGREDGGKYGCASSILVTEQFADKYRNATQKLVTTLVKDRIWAVNPKNKNDQYKLWAKSGYPYRTYKEDLDKADWALRFSPLLDQEFRDSYKSSVQDSLDFKLIREPVDVDSWFDESYVTKALSDLGLTQQNWHE